MFDDFFVRGAVRLGGDVRFRVPFGVGDELMRFPAAEELFRDTAFLFDHERRAFLLQISIAFVTSEGSTVM
jgi:hypothetical protein